jgi:hypothetical protein
VIRLGFDEKEKEIDKEKKVRGNEELINKQVP